MAITGQQVSAIGDILKIFYLGPVREQLNNATVTLKRVQRNKEDVSGSQANMPIHIKRNLGIGARGDAASLPTASKQGYDTATVETKYNYGRLEVTGPSIAASRNDRGAFLRILDSEIKGLTRDLKADINRQLHNDGTGILAKVGSAVTSTTATTGTVTMAKRFWKNPNYYLPDNFKFSLLASDLNTINFSAQVNGVTTSTSLPWDTGTSKAAATTAFVCKKASHIDGGKAASTAQLEMMGYRGIVDDGNVMGDTTSTNTGLFIQTIDAGSSSAVAQWRSNVLENPVSAGTNRALDLDLMQEAMDKVEILQGGNVSLILTTAGIRRKYADICRADRRYIKEMVLDGGFKAVEYNGVPIVVDKDCTNYNMLFLDESTFQLFQMADFSWMDEDGAVLSRVSNYDAYEAVLYLYSEFGCSNRAYNARLADINETEL